MKFLNEKKYINRQIFFSSILLAFCNLICINNSLAQNNYEKAIEYFQKTAEENKLVNDDLSELIVTDQYISKKSGVEHIYFKQAFKGIEVNRSNSNIHFTKENDVLIANNRFIANYKSKINTATPKLNAIAAIKSASTKAGLGEPKELKNIEKEEGDNRNGLYSTGGISRSDIPVKLVYQLDRDSNLKLGWDLMIRDINSIDSWHFIVDAVTGEILKKTNAVVGCNHSNGEGREITGVVKSSVTKQKSNTFNNRLSPPPAYEVYDLPLESPEEGIRTIVEDPADSEASPFGWHLAGNTTTLGNNINAFTPDEFGTSMVTNGYRPDGGFDLQFTNFDLDLEGSPYDYRDAAVTNAFYIANKVHDILFLNGFDEASGNFQAINYGTEGYQNDLVNILVHYNDGCGSTLFQRMPDGMQPQLLLGLCDWDDDFDIFLTGEVSNIRDGAYSNTSIIHEYGHGLSSRLVGGPSDAYPHENEENLREGWSDFLAILLTMKPTDTRLIPRTYGSWFYLAESGARPYQVASWNNVPYTTDFTVNSFTYNDIDGLPYVHSVGFVWCTMLWEMNWGLINLHGFDSDMYRGTGGNNIALELIILGMKLMASNPGFIDGRDALLAADKALYDGAHECIIWEAFAKRGLGFGASQGSPYDKTDGVESMYMPDYCSGVCDPIINHTDSVVTSTYQASNAIISTGIIYDNKIVEYNAGNYICLNPNFKAELSSGYYFLAEIEDCSTLKESGGNSSAYLSKFSITNNPNPFSSQTTIEYQLQEDLPVTVFVSNTIGNTIAEISKKEYKTAGKHQVVFDGTKLPAGIYYCTIQAGNHIETQKMGITK